MAEVYSLVRGVIELSLAISTAAQVVQAFDEKSGQLARRCRRIQGHMEKLMETRKFAHHVEKEIEQLHVVFEEVKKFLDKLGNARTMKQLVQHSKYEARFQTLHQEIDRTWSDIGTALHIHMPLNEGDNVDDKKPKEDIALPPNLFVKDPDRPDPVDEDAKTEYNDSDDEDDDEDDEPPPPRPFDRFYVDFDFTPAQSADRVSFFGSPSPSFNSLASRADLKAWCGKIDPLRKMEQSTRVTKIEVITAKLKEGDTVPVVRSLATALALFVPALVVVNSAALFDELTGGHAGSDLLTNVVPVPIHFLLRCEFADGSDCTLERCVDDVHLYFGRSSRRGQYTRLTKYNVDGVTLRDLIRFRNTERRRQPYNLRTNNCKHFAFVALKSLLGQPDGLQLQWKSLDDFIRHETVTTANRFIAICQMCDGRILP